MLAQESEGSSIKSTRQVEKDRQTNKVVIFVTRYFCSFPSIFTIRGSAHSFKYLTCRTLIQYNYHVENASQIQNIFKGFVQL